MSKTVLNEGRFLRFIQQDGWEYVERIQNQGVVVIVATTEENSLLLVEQFRPPVDTSVIELPAGLVADQPEFKNEGLLEAARRELLEETGFHAENLRVLTQGPTSAGLTNEIVTMIAATQLTRQAAGGGDESENILVHEIHLSAAETWLERQRSEGKLIDPKIYIALYLARSMKA